MAPPKTTSKLYALLYTDKPDMLELRLKTRPAHLEYIASLGNIVKAGGPFLDEDDNPNGSLIVIEAENQTKALEIAAHDPYVRADLFSKVEAKQWKWLI